MKNLKKLLSLLLILAMVMSIAACGKTEKKEPEKKDTKQENTKKDEPKKEGTKPYEGKTLKVAGLKGGYGEEGWKAVVAKFEELTGAKVDLKLEKNIDEVVRPQIQAGDVPDVLYFSVGQKSGLTETLVKEKLLVEITDVLDMKVLGEEKKVSEKILPGFLDTFITMPYGDGKTYLAPLFYSPTGLWYNRSLFKEDGGKYELPKTFEEFFKLGETAKADGIALFTYPVAGYFDTFVFSLINEVGGPTLFNKLMNYDVEAWKTEAKPVFETIGKIAPYLEPNTVAQANNEGFTKNQQSVIDSKALFMPNGTWIIGEMKKTTPEGFKWGYMALPQFNENGRYAYTFFEQAYIVNGAKEVELAKIFLSFLYSDEAAKLFASNGGAIQPIFGASKLAQEELQAVYNIYETGVKASMGSFANAPAVEGADRNDLFKTIDSVMNGSKTVEQWHTDYVKVIEAIKAAIQ